MNKLLFYLIIFLSLSSSVFASPNIQARTAILLDYHSDEVLYELDPDSQI